MTAALALAAVLVGCTPQAPAPTVRPTVEAPVYASEEEALAAATEAYGAYLLVSDEIIRDGGADPERLKPYVSAEIYKSERDGYLWLGEQGYRGTGSTNFSLQIQRFGNAMITTYACEDISGTDVLDSAGVSVVDPGRSAFRAYEVDFDVTDGLRITRMDRWEGTGVC